MGFICSARPPLVGQPFHRVTIIMLQKSMWKLLLPLLIAGLGPAVAGAQSGGSGAFTAGALFTNRGFGVELGYYTGRESRLFRFGLEVRGLRDDHEAKIDPINPDRGRRYTYGKLNTLTLINPSLGVEWNVMPQSTLSLSNFRLGITAAPIVGLLNPYYLQVCNFAAGQGCILQDDPVPFDPDRHNFFNIQGQASFSQYPFRPELVLGGSAGAYVLMDLSAQANLINAFKFGVSLDAFAQKVPLIVESSMLSNRQFFFTASLGLIFGSRWE